MGKDYIPLRLNGYGLKKAYNLLINNRVKEWSYSQKVKPLLNEIEEIEIGTNGKEVCTVIDCHI